MKPTTIIIWVLLICIVIMSTILRNIEADMRDKQELTNYLECVRTKDKEVCNKEFPNALQRVSQTQQ